MKSFLMSWVLVGFLAAASAEATSFEVPMPVKSGVVCSDAGIDVLATANSDGAAVKISANRKSKILPVQTAKSGNVITYTGAEGRLDVDFDRTLPGNESVLGELDVEFDGERIRIDIPCRLLFMGGKQPSLKVWQ